MPVLNYAINQNTKQAYKYQYQYDNRPTELASTLRVSRMIAQEKKFNDQLLAEKTMLNKYMVDFNLEQEKLAAVQSNNFNQVLGQLGDPMAAGFLSATSTLLQDIKQKQTEEEVLARLGANDLKNKMVSSLKRLEVLEAASKKFTDEQIELLGTDDNDLSFEELEEKQDLEAIQDFKDSFAPQYETQFLQVYNQFKSADGLQNAASRQWVKNYMARFDVETPEGFQGAMAGVPDATKDFKEWQKDRGNTQDDILFTTQLIDIFDQLQKENVEPGVVSQILLDRLGEESIFTTIGLSAIADLGMGENATNLLKQAGAIIGAQVAPMLKQTVTGQVSDKDIMLAAKRIPWLAAGKSWHERILELKRSRDDSLNTLAGQSPEDAAYVAGYKKILENPGLGDWVAQNDYEMSALNSLPDDDDDGGGYQTKALGEVDLGNKNPPNGFQSIEQAMKEPDGVSPVEISKPLEEIIQILDEDGDDTISWSELVSMPGGLEGVAFAALADVGDDDQRARLVGEALDDFEYIGNGRLELKGTGRSYYVRDEDTFLGLGVYDLQALAGELALDVGTMLTMAKTGAVGGAGLGAVGGITGAGLGAIAGYAMGGYRGFLARGVAKQSLRSSLLSAARSPQSTVIRTMAQGSGIASTAGQVKTRGQNLITGEEGNILAQANFLEETGEDLVYGAVGAGAAKLGGRAIKAIGARATESSWPTMLKDRLVQYFNSEGATVQGAKAILDKLSPSRIDKIAITQQEMRNLYNRLIETGVNDKAIMRAMVKSAAPLHRTVQNIREVARTVPGKVKDFATTPEATRAEVIALRRVKDEVEAIMENMSLDAIKRDTLLSAIVEMDDSAVKKIMTEGASKDKKALFESLMPKRATEVTPAEDFVEKVIEVGEGQYKVAARHPGLNRIYSAVGEVVDASGSKPKLQGIVPEVLESPEILKAQDSLAQLGTGRQSSLWLVDALSRGARELKKLKLTKAQEKTLKDVGALSKGQKRALKELVESYNRVATGNGMTLQDIFYITNTANKFLKEGSGLALQRAEAGGVAPQYKQLGEFLERVRTRTNRMIPYLFKEENKWRGLKIQDGNGQLVNGRGNLGQVMNAKKVKNVDADNTPFTRVAPLGGDKLSNYAYMERFKLELRKEWPLKIGSDLKVLDEVDKVLGIAPGKVADRVTFKEVGGAILEALYRGDAEFADFVANGIKTSNQLFGREVHLENLGAYAVFSLLRNSKSEAFGRYLVPGKEYVFTSLFGKEEGMATIRGLRGLMKIIKTEGEKVSRMEQAKEQATKFITALGLQAGGLTTALTTPISYGLRGLSGVKRLLSPHSSGFLEEMTRIAEKQGKPLSEVLETTMGTETADALMKSLSVYSPRIYAVSGAVLAELAHEVYRD